MTLGWLGISGKTRIIQCSTASRQPKLARAYTPTSRGKRIPPISTITSTWPSLRGSPLQMSFTDELLTPLTVSLCPGCMMKKGQESVAG